MSGKSPIIVFFFLSFKVRNVFIEFRICFFLINEIYELTKDIFSSIVCTTSFSVTRLKKFLGLPSNNQQRGTNVNMLILMVFPDPST